MQMNFLKILTAGLFASFFLTKTAYATLIDNGDYVTDTVSGYDWLDLTATTNHSYNSILAEVMQGGIFQGWSIASMANVDDFFTNAGGNGIYKNSSNNTALFQVLQPLWGITHQSLGRSYFHVLDESTAGITTGKIIYANGTITEHVNDFSNASTRYSIIGTALFRVTAPTPKISLFSSPAVSVPEPSTAVILALGLFGLVARRIKN